MIATQFLVDSPKKAAAKSNLFPKLEYTVQGNGDFVIIGGKCPYHHPDFNTAVCGALKATHFQTLTRLLHTKGSHRVSQSKASFLANHYEPAFRDSDYKFGDPFTFSGKGIHPSDANLEDTMSKEIENCPHGGRIVLLYGKDQFAAVTRFPDPDRIIGNSPYVNILHLIYEMREPKYISVEQKG